MTISALLSRVLIGRISCRYGYRCMSTTLDVSVDEQTGIKCIAILSALSPMNHINISQDLQ